MTKVQVPLLVVLGYLLLCLIYPKAWVGFDWNPANAEVDMGSSQLVVRNGSGNVLWKKPFAGRLLPTSSVVVTDLGNNDTNEVLFMPAMTVSSPERGWFFAYSYEGKLLFKRYGGICDSFSGDHESPLLEGEYLSTFSYRGGTGIISEMNSNDPTLSCIRLWTEEGDSLRSYVNPGGTHFCLARDIDSDSTNELFFACYNNPENAVALLVLDPDSIWGVGPPDLREHLDLSRLKLGSQLAYVLFPVTDLGKYDLRTVCNDPATNPIREDTEDEIKVYVCESPAFEGNCLVIYYFDYTLRLRKVRVTGQFAKRRQQLVEQGSLKAIDDSLYLEQLANCVLYWTDRGWMTWSQLRTQEQ